MLAKLKDETDPSRELRHAGMQSVFRAIVEPTLGRLFRTPSDFPADPWGYARNQAGHGALGAGAAWLGLGLAGVTGAGWIAPAVPGVYLAGFAVWEWLQVRRHGAEPADGVEDWTMSALPALAASDPAARGLLALWGILFAAGVIRRVRDRNRA